jgi:hypothetical protein
MAPSFSIRRYGERQRHLMTSSWRPRLAQPQLSQNFIRPIPGAFFKRSCPLLEIHKMQRKRFRRHFSAPIWRLKHSKANRKYTLG